MDVTRIILILATVAHEETGNSRVLGHDSSSISAQVSNSLMKYFGILERCFFRPHLRYGH